MKHNLWPLLLLAAAAPAPAPASHVPHRVQRALCSLVCYCPDGNGPRTSVSCTYYTVCDRATTPTSGLPITIGTSSWPPATTWTTWPHTVVSSSKTGNTSAASPTGGYQQPSPVLAEHV